MAACFFPFWDAVIENPAGLRPSARGLRHKMGRSQYVKIAPVYDAARQELYQTLTIILKSDFNRLRRREQIDILLHPRLATKMEN